MYRREVASKNSYHGDATSHLNTTLRMENDTQLAISRLRATFESMSLALRKNIFPRKMLSSKGKTELKMIFGTQIDNLTNACGSEQSPVPHTAPMAIESLMNPQLKFCNRKSRGRFAIIISESQRVATPYAKDDEEEMKKRQNLRKNKKVYLNVRLQEAEASLKDRGEDETKKRGIQKKNKKVGLNVRLQAVQVELQQGSQPPSPEER
ncbi:hypothetical protein C8J57DRAFT_1226000 [Mycena rebaudengoi]|nr:hypothetical protein C8J57DRAFT_1226000 [Mycena rebaudengoi]